MSSTGPSGARGQTITAQEKAEAVKAGADPYHYSHCRKTGASHAEVLEAHRASARLQWYPWCRQAGASHAEVLEASRAGADLFWYAWCRQLDVNHAEALEAHEAGAGLGGYADCHRIGAVHPEAIALRLREAGLGPLGAAKFAVPALRAACGTNPTRELGETIATLAQDWAGTADELAATAVALLSTRTG